MKNNQFELVRTDKNGSTTVAKTHSWVVAVSSIKQLSEINKCLEKTETTCDVLEDGEMVTYSIQ